MNINNVIVSAKLLGLCQIASRGTDIKRKSSAISITRTTHTTKNRVGITSRTDNVAITNLLGQW